MPTATPLALNPLRKNRSTSKLTHNVQTTSLTATGDSNERESDWSWLLFLSVPLLLTYVSNQWSRSSIYYLVNFSGDGDSFSAMNVDLSFSEAQYGLLASVAFTSLFAVASLGAGVASDRYNRKSLTTASALAWSVATLGTGLSTSYEQVVLWRVAMGLACAFSTPTAYTLIQEQVPKDRAAFASSLYGSGVALGGAFASLSIILDTEIGWRAALYIIAAFGFGSAALSTLLLPNDPKESKTVVEGSVVDHVQVNQGDSAITEQVGQILSTDRVKWLFLASFLRFCSGLCIGVWSAPFFRMEFADRVSDYAVAQALITSVCGISSGLFGGIAADWLSSNASKSDGTFNDPVGLKLWVPVVGSVLAAPAFYYAVHSGGSFEIAMACLAVEYLVAECWFGPTVNVLQSTVGPGNGGTAQGLFTLTGAIANLAPSLLGFVYADATGVEVSSDLASLLSIFVCGCYLLSAACFVLSAQSTPPRSPQKSENSLAAAKAE